VIDVMVVEDHELVREAVCEALDAEDGVRVVACCADGLEAVEVLGRVRPDVVVTDLSMPRMDGVATTTYVRRHHPQVRVLVLTSAPNGKLAAQALTAGAEAVVAKNIDLSPLVDAVRAAPGRV